MSLPNNPNQISLADIQNEFGGAAPISPAEYYSNQGDVLQGVLGYPGGIETVIPESGPISLDNFHGASKFTAIKIVSSCSWTVPPGVTSIDILTVAGGAGGGHGNEGDGGGGGGAGGVHFRKNVPVTPGTVLGFQIGAGGGGAIGNGFEGGAGGDTYATSWSGSPLNPNYLYANGGGGGAGSSQGFVAAGGGQPGGSGGGGCGIDRDSYGGHGAISELFPAGNSIWGELGHDGGYASRLGAGGGGGGAGTRAQNSNGIGFQEGTNNSIYGTNALGGDGGSGINVLFKNPTRFLVYNGTSYWTEIPSPAQLTPTSAYRSIAVAGGGGGGQGPFTLQTKFTTFSAQDFNLYYAGLGGVYAGNQDGTHASPNTGSGGGGTAASNFAGRNGGNGGSGVVYIFLNNMLKTQHVSISASSIQGYQRFSYSDTGRIRADIGIRFNTNGTTTSLVNEDAFNSAPSDPSTDPNPPNPFAQQTKIVPPPNWFKTIDGLSVTNPGNNYWINCDVYGANIGNMSWFTLTGNVTGWQQLSSNREWKLEAARDAPRASRAVAQYRMVFQFSKDAGATIENEIHVCLAIALGTVGNI